MNPTRGELAYALKAAVCVIRHGSDPTGLLVVVDETLQRSYAEGLVPRDLPASTEAEGRTKISLSLWHYAAGIKRAREKKGLSMRRLCAAAGFSHGYVSYLESARRRPSLDTLEALAFAMEMSLSELIRECEEGTREG